MGEPKSVKEQEILESIVKAELDFIIYVDVETKDTHVIVTKEGMELTLSKDGEYDAIKQELITKYVHPEDKDHFAQQMELANIELELSQKERAIIICSCICGGAYRRKEMNIHYHGEDKKTLVFICRDITDSYEEEQLHKERLYRALMDARHANQEKNEFLERMSHEIRTPMNSIIGLSYLTSEYVDNHKQVLENLDKITLSAHFLLSFIDDILNLSQIESGNIALIQENTDFNSFIEEISLEVGKKCESKQIEFSTEKRGVFEQEYEFDKDKFYKALLNILDNAVKFTQPEGRVEFIVEKLTETDREATIRFEVRDNGIGMEDDFLPHVFEPFEQESNPGTTLTGGTGFGLAIAKNIIDFMGGRIDAYSEKGRGSTFVATVTLKKVVETEKSVSKQSKLEHMDYDFSGKRVLLVEDNEINIEITKNILTHKNLEVEVAVNGEEGVDDFLNHEPGYYDVILMDIRMPVMDGLTATRKIRNANHPDSTKIPIIAMTANAFEEDVHKSLEAGMNAHLSKPVDVRQMYFVLDSMIFG